MERGAVTLDLAVLLCSYATPRGLSSGSPFPQPAAAKRRLIFYHVVNYFTHLKKKAISKTREIGNTVQQLPAVTGPASRAHRLPSTRHPSSERPRRLFLFCPDQAQPSYSLTCFSTRKKHVVLSPPDPGTLQWPVLSCCRARANLQRAHVRVHGTSRWPGRTYREWRCTRALAGPGCAEPSQTAL